MNSRFSLFAGAAAAALVLSMLPASAITITITPTGTSFGTLANATFGGSGIPNDAVQITTIGNLTLGLTATARYANDPVTNDGNGTFYAQAGGDVLDSAPAYAKWNFDYYINGLNGTNQAVYFFWDTDPAVGNDVPWTFATYPSVSYPIASQDSWNLGFQALGLGHVAFNPDASGEYGFALVAFDLAGNELGRSAIIVNVGSSPPIPDGGSTVLLLGGALVAGVALRRRLTR